MIREALHAGHSFKDFTLYNDVAEAQGRPAYSLAASKP